MTQLLAVFRLEIRKTFFARRGLWVYVLAFAPVLLFAANSIYAPRERTRLASLAAAHPSATHAGLAAIHPGLTREEVVTQLGEPYAIRRGEPAVSRSGGPCGPPEPDAGGRAEAGGGAAARTPTRRQRAAAGLAAVEAFAGADGRSGVPAGLISGGRLT